MHVVTACASRHVPLCRNADLETILATDLNQLGQVPKLQALAISALRARLLRELEGLITTQQASGGKSITSAYNKAKQVWPWGTAAPTAHSAGPSAWASLRRAIPMHHAANAWPRRAGLTWFGYDVVAQHPGCRERRRTWLLLLMQPPLTVTLVAL